MAPSVPHSPLGGEGAEATNGGGGGGVRGRDASTAVGGSADDSSPGGAATLQEPQGSGATAGLGSPARPVSPVGDSSSGPAADGGEAAPAAERRAAVPDARLQDLLSRISPRSPKVSKAMDLVDKIVRLLIGSFRNQSVRFTTVVLPKAGIYCQRLKISEPNEFEVLLEMDEKGLQLSKTDDSGAFYNLCFKKQPSEESGSDCLENGILSASKMLNTLRKIIEIKIKKSIPYVTVKRKRRGSPAITLLITHPPADISVDIILTLEAQQGWPSSTEDGLKIEQWLGRKVKRDYRLKPLYLVAKQNKKEKDLKGNTWRLSFSHIEKLMMTNHGNTKTCCESDGVKCCRKACLKLLKYLLERLKMKYPEKLEKICSYYVKTAFFHSCTKWPNDTDWPVGGLEHCFQRFLKHFLDCLQRSHLPHFFIPQYNLLGLEDKASSDFLSRQINYEWNNGFPIFQETS